MCMLSVHCFLLMDMVGGGMTVKTCTRCLRPWFCIQSDANNTADVDVHVEVRQVKKGQRNRINWTRPVLIQIKKCRWSFISSSPS